MKRMAIIVLLAALVAPIASLRAAPQATATGGQVYHSKGDYGVHNGHDLVSQEATINTGTIRYGLKYNACWDKAHDAGAGYLEGYLGMPWPSSANWYHSGFLGLKINGVDLGATRMSDIWVAEQGERGTVKLYFDTPQAGVTVTAAAQAADDRLFVGLLLNPKEEIKSLDLRLVCYPSYFTYHNKREGDRRLLTATQTYKQGDKPVIKPAEQSWMAFYDTVFDPDKGEGDGGCAVAYLPDQVEEIKVDVGGYACISELKLKPQTRAIKLVFWDFNKVGNQAALTKLAGVMPQTLEALRAYDWTPLAAARYDAALKTETAKAQMGTLPGREELVKKLETKAAEIAALKQEVAEGKSKEPGSVERALGERIKEFEALLWDVKFFILIHG